MAPYRNAHQVLCFLFLPRFPPTQSWRKIFSPKYIETIFLFLRTYVALPGFEPGFLYRLHGSKCASLLNFSERFFGVPMRSGQNLSVIARSSNEIIHALYGTSILLPQAFPFKLLRPFNPLLPAEGEGCTISFRSNDDSKYFCFCAAFLRS